MTEEIKHKNEIKSETKSRKPNSMPFLIFWQDHLRSLSGIIFGSGSFAVQFGDHFRSGDHLPSGIICCAVVPWSKCSDVRRSSKLRCCEKCLSQRHEAAPIAMLSLKVNKSCFVVSLCYMFINEVFLFLKNFVLVMASKVVSKVFTEVFEKKDGF